MDRSKKDRKTSLNFRIIIIVLILAFMVFAIAMMLAPRSSIAHNGKITLSSEDFRQNETVSLDGDWEFYWDQLLTPADFTRDKLPHMDSLMKVPGTWDEKETGTQVYPNHGVVTYRLCLNYPSIIKEPALRVQGVATAYKLYVNGKLMAEVGTVSKNPSDFKDGMESLVIDLPKDTKTLELIFQVANLDYAKGGLRASPIFGSKQVLEQQKMILLALQLLFIGSIFIFAIYYLFIFLLQSKNKTALLFSLLCFNTAIRSLFWGTTPVMIFFSKIPFEVSSFINYLTGYNLIPLMVLFVLSLYPLEYKKTILRLVLLPTLFFDLLLFTPPPFMSLFTNYLYIVILLQMVYVISVLVKAVMHKRDNAILMFIVIGVFVLTIIQDILRYKGIGGMQVAYMFLYGNFAVIMAMSFVQVRIQANTHKKLLLYNEKLVEADRLKDKIMETEMSFLHAQIKPHFLYNALDAIANVCEEDGEKASELIVDLSIYLRESLEFNSLDKMVRIGKELEFVRIYFNIEQARFGEKIQLLEAIEVSLDSQVPALILQPLVENAVRHGISKKPLCGKVTIRATQMPEGISIEIEDDGVGIEGDILALLLSDERKDKGVGLLNIHNRLLSLYGNGLEISSKVGSGTCVKLVIPNGGKKQL
ncbi:MAG: histidine kinase [Sedimentibacter sp.]